MDADLMNILNKIISNQTIFKSAKLVNDTLTVVLNGGEIITLQGASKEDYESVINAKSSVEIKKIITTNYKEEEEENNPNINPDQKNSFKTKFNRISKI